MFCLRKNQSPNIPVVHKDEAFMIKRMRSEIIKIWDWLIIDFEKLMLSASKGRLNLQAQPIPIL
ncbi:hypothetical protein LCGC14_0773450 [marine sediment metagenome]|uniref:Uncharacterized protein n=1 Tax=marine sediment metagenome TaxID=412755 RepID=A0A0F9SHL7_9ZZZZ